MVLLYRNNATINAHVKLESGSNTGSDTLTRDPETRFHLHLWSLYSFADTKLLISFCKSTFIVQSILMNAQNSISCFILARTCKYDSSLCKVLKLLSAIALDAGTTSRRFSNRFTSLNAERRSEDLHRSCATTLATECGSRQIANHHKLTFKT